MNIKREEIIQILEEELSIHRVLKGEHLIIGIGSAAKKIQDKYEKILH